jgi:hypothetical protein
MLEFKGFRINRSKTEYMQCKFSAGRNTIQSVTLDGKTILLDNYFRYLESIIQKNRELNSDITHWLAEMEGCDWYFV